MVYARCARPGRVQMGGDEGVNYVRAVAMEGGKGRSVWAEVTPARPLS